MEQKLVKVYNIDNIAWVAATSKEEATECYQSETGLAVSSIADCDIKRDGLYKYPLEGLPVWISFERILMFNKYEKPRILKP